MSATPKATPPSSRDRTESPRPETADATSWWRRAECAGVLAACIAAVNVLPNGFCYDDVLIVGENPLVHEPGRWPDVWTTDHWSAMDTYWALRDLLYRPLTLSTYRIVHSVAGADAWPQHLVNVLLHALICLLVVRLGRALGGTEPAVMVAGLAFAVLPIHTEVVASVVGRADLLATVGVLLSVLCHRRGTLASTSTQCAAWFALAGLGAFGAMCAKESGMAAIPLIVLFDVLCVRHGSDVRQPQSWWRWRTAVRLSYLLVPLVVYAALRYHALGGRLHQAPPLTKPINVLVDAPSWQYALGVVQLWGMYWAKTFWPAILSIKYSINSIHLATSVWDVHVLLGLLALAVLAAASAAAWRRGRREVAVLSAALVVSYLPTSNALVLMQVFFAERIWYLPSVFLCLLFGLAAASLMRARFSHVALAVLLVAMAGRGWLRQSEWRNNGTLYAAAVRDQPDGVGPLHLFGKWLVDHGEHARALPFLQRAVEIDLGYTAAHRDLGRAYLALGNYTAAVRHLQLANMQVPNQPATLETLEHARSALARAGQDRLEALRSAADASPNDVNAEIELIRALRSAGLIDEARRRLAENEPRFRDNAAWQAEYAVTLVYQNDLDAAIERYEASLEIQPQRPQRMVELAMLLRERQRGGDLDRAWDLADRAVELAPDAPAVLACKAELLVQRGEIDRAITLYEKALQALPADSPLRRVYHQRARTLGR